MKGTMLLGVLGLAAVAAAAPAFPPGYAEGFPVIEGPEWTGPSLEPVLDHGLRYKVCRLDGEIKEGTVGSLREQFLRALPLAGWPVPSEFRVNTLERFEEIFFRKQDQKLQWVELAIFRQDEINYVIVKARADRLAAGFDPAKVVAWHLPNGYGEAFPFHPLVMPSKVAVETVEDKSIGVQAYKVSAAQGLISGVALPEVVDWYKKKLKEDKWPVPSFFNQDDDERFEQPFQRRRDGKRMLVQLILEQPRPELPVKWTLNGQENQESKVDDEMAKQMEEQQEEEAKKSDPSLQIVDVDPSDPDIDFIEFPRGFGAGFPVHPDTQFIQGKIRENEVIGQKWKEAVIFGAFPSLTVAQVKDWYLKAAGEAGYDVPSIHEEEEENLLQTKFRRNTGNFDQVVSLKIFVRPQDGITEADLVVQQDSERSSEEDNPESMIGPSMPSP